MWTSQLGSLTLKALWVLFLFPSYTISYVEENGGARAARVDYWDNLTAPLENSKSLVEFFTNEVQTEFTLRAGVLAPIGLANPFNCYRREVDPR